MKVTQDTNYLSPKFVVDNLVEFVYIKNEGEMVEKEFEGKKSMRLQVQTECLVKGQQEQRPWTMNGTSKTTLMELFGDETKNWIGPKIFIQVVKGGNGKDTIYVDKLRTKAAAQQSGKLA